MATFTITTPSGQDARIAAAFGRLLLTVDASGAPRSATGAEIKQAIVGWVKAVVKEREQAVARDNAIATVTEVTPT